MLYLNRSGNDWFWIPAIRIKRQHRNPVVVCSSASDFMWNIEHFVKIVVNKIKVRNAVYRD